MDSDIKEREKWDERLPSRLFATDRFPVARLNVYSKPDTLAFIHDALRGTPELETILNSCFGKLFELPVRRLPISCKLVHALLVRQLVTKKKYEMWTVFGGQPMRFSLVEFAHITGLPCGEFPEDYEPEDVQLVTVKKCPYWKKLIGNDTHATLGDIGAMFESDPGMPSWRKLRLALLLIVDGVLVARSQVHRPTPLYVSMLEDVDSFLSFPWGRESFLRTISAMIPGKKVPGKIDDPVGCFRKQMQQQTIRLTGFALALQLLAYHSVSGLLSKLSNADDERGILDITSARLPYHTELGISDVLDVEFDPELSVVPLMHMPLETEEGWDDEIRDKKTTRVEELVSEGHAFSKPEWPGGDASLPLYVHEPKQQPGVAHKKHIRSRKKKEPLRANKKQADTKRRRASNMKQHTLEDYFTCAPANDADQIRLLVQSRLEDVTGALNLQIQRLTKRIDSLERRVKAKRIYRHGRLSRRRWRVLRKKKVAECKALATEKATDSGMAMGDGILARIDIVDSAAVGNNLTESLVNNQLEMIKQKKEMHRRKETEKAREEDHHEGHSRESEIAERKRQRQRAEEEDRKSKELKRQKIENDSKLIDVSPPETRQTCDDVNGSNAEKKTKEEECLLHEKQRHELCSECNKEEGIDERLKQIKPAIEEIALKVEKRIMKVQNTLAMIREWKTKRNQTHNGVSI